jgi:hypothetical protein
MISNEGCLDCSQLVKTFFSQLRRLCLQTAHWRFAQLSLCQHIYLSINLRVSTHRIGNFYLTSAAEKSVFTDNGILGEFNLLWFQNLT